MAQINNILQSILQQTGQFVGQDVKGAKERRKSAIDILGNLISNSIEGANQRRGSLVAGFQQGFNQQPQPSGQAEAATVKQPESPIDMVRKKGLNKIADGVSSQIEQAQTQGATPVDLINTLNQILPETQPGSQAVAGPQGGVIVGQAQQSTPEALPALDVNQQAQDILAQLSNPETQALISEQAQPQIQPELNQNSIPPNKDNTIFRNIIKSFVNTLDPTFETQQLINQERRQKIEGKQPLQEKRKRELQIQHENRISQIQEEARLKGTEVSNVGAGLNVVADDMRNLIQARRNIPLRGAPLGGIVGKGASLLGLPGSQKDARAQFESFAETLSFSFGEHVLGQKGRFFTEGERKAVKEKIISASLLSSERRFEGKMKAIIKQMNSRLLRDNPNAKLFDEDINKLLQSRQSKQQDSGQKSFKSGSTIGRFKVEVQ